MYIRFGNGSQVITKNNNTMTRKEAATIMKKYEKNGMIGLNVKQEYFNAQQILIRSIWAQLARKSKK